MNFATNPTLLGGFSGFRVFNQPPTLQQPVFRVVHVCLLEWTFTLVNRCALPPRHRVFRPRPPSMRHADVEHPQPFAPHTTHSPGRRPAEARCEVRPVRRRRSRPVAATDRRRPFLIAATGSVCDSGTWPDPPGWQGGSQHGQTTCHRRSSTGAPPVLVPGGGKSSRLCCPPA